MSDLWRKAFLRIIQNPLLLLPVVVADFLAYCLKYAHSLLLAQIIHWASRQQSVMGSYESPSMQSTLKAGAVDTPLQQLVFVLIFLFYVLAMAATYRYLYSEKRLPTTKLLKGVNSSAALILTAKAYGITAAAFLLLEALALTLLKGNRNFDSLLFGYGSTLLAPLCLVFFLTPSALRFLKPEGVKHDWIQKGRFCGVGAALLTSLIAALLQRFFNSPTFHDVSLNMLSRWIVNAVSSSITALPYGALFVAFAVVLGPNPAPQPQNE